jgi:hypothetical protein
MLRTTAQPRWSVEVRNKDARKIERRQELAGDVA